MDPIRRRRALSVCGSLFLPAVAGCVDGDAPDTTDRGPLSVGEFAFAASRPTGYGEYEAQPDATYRRGESLWLYVELDGLSAEPVGGAVQIDVDERRVVEHVDRDLRMEKSEEYGQQVQPDQLDSFYLRSELSLAGNTATGEYRLTVEYTDNVSGTSATESGTFTVVEGDD